MKRHSFPIGPAHSLIASALLLALPVAAESTGEPGRAGTEPNPLKNVYFGEQHLHSSASPDAFAFGTRNDANDAYLFAKGEAIKNAQSGQMIQKRTPYDWAAVTDHAEYLGMMPLLLDPTSPLQQTEIGKLISKGDKKSGEAAFQQIITSATVNKPIDYLVDPKIMKTAWQKQVDAANKHYHAGKFTTLVAFEWSSQPNSKNLHHNVFFRDDGPERVFSAFESVHREDLWIYQEYQRVVGHENFSIPHNSNVSSSAMFALHTSRGNPIDERWAYRSARNSPAVEIKQTKGASETHPALSPNDEFAEFEIFPNMINVGHPSQIKNGFIRQALSLGMIVEERVGSNPYKMGIVAGSDSHSGYSNNEEFNFFGSHGALEDTPQKRLNPEANASGDLPSRLGSAGTTAVWADENTRAGIFDGMKRKETYGTSGTLIRPRFFGGWKYGKDLVKDKMFVEKVYKGGVPMGGDLPEMESKAPTFAVWALKDPESGNLDRIQIIKCFINKSGGPGEQIYDVALSDGRKADAKGKIPPAGNTVDVSKATYTNDIGDTQLSVVWTDPDFDPTKPAAYYVRVLEIPTPRWSTYDSVRAGLPIPEGIPATIQERARSSPIWYTPPKEN